MPDGAEPRSPSCDSRVCCDKRCIHWDRKTNHPHTNLVLSMSLMQSSALSYMYPNMSGLLSQ